MRLFSVISRTLVWVEYLTPLQRCSRCIQQPDLTGPPGHSLAESYPSTEKQSVYSTALSPADWATRTIFREGLTPLQRCNRCILHPPNAAWAKNMHKFLFIACCFGSREEHMNSRVYYCKVKRKQDRSGFEVRSLVLFSRTIIITLNRPPGFYFCLEGYFRLMGVCICATNPKHSFRFKLIFQEEQNLIEFKSLFLLERVLY